MKKYREFTEKNLMKIYNKLLSSFGQRGWWPADTPFEVAISAILTQNTSWKNVKKAIDNLKEKKLLSPQKLYKIDTQVLAGEIKSSGYYNQKAKKIKNFLEFFKKYNFSFRKMSPVNVWELRAELLDVNGIGEETADSILLYALDKPVFVIDAYTKRIFHRLGFINENIKYSELQKYFAENLIEDNKLFNEYHALIDNLAHFICRKKPECGKCVLNKDCRYYKECFI